MSIVVAGEELLLSQYDRMPVLFTGYSDPIPGASKFQTDSCDWVELLMTYSSKRNPNRHRQKEAMAGRDKSYLKWMEENDWNWRRRDEALAGRDEQFLAAMEEATRRDAEDGKKKPPARQMTAPSHATDPEVSSVLSHI